MIKQNIFEPGDEVRFLDEIGSAVVVKVLYDGMVLIRTEDDFEYPVLPDQLVLIKKTIIKSIEKEPHKAVVSVPKMDVTHQRTKPDTKPSYAPKRENVRISLAYTPINKSEQGSGQLLLQLVNDSDYELLFQVLKHDDTGIRSVAIGNAEPGFIEELCLWNRESLNQLKKLSVQLIFCAQFGVLQRSPIEKHFKPEPVWFFTVDNFTENDYFDTPALFMDVINDKEPDANLIEKLNNLQELLNEKEIIPENKSARFKAREKSIPIEVDLHINAILDNFKGLSNAEILDYQMKHFHKSITDAMFNKAEKVVFIHGIGNGTLREKVRESLKSQYHLNFQDASFQEFGFGATMVFLNGKNA